MLMVVFDSGHLNIRYARIFFSGYKTTLGGLSYRTLKMPTPFFIEYRRENINDKEVKLVVYCPNCVPSQECYPYVIKTTEDGSWVEEPPFADEEKKIEEVIERAKKCNKNIRMYKDALKEAIKLARLMFHDILKVEELLVDNPIIF